MNKFSLNEAAQIRGYYLGECDIVGTTAWDKLYGMFYREMPYGTAKARDGDPDQWIVDNWSDWTDTEFLGWLSENTDFKELPTDLIGYYLDNLWDGSFQADTIAMILMKINHQNIGEINNK